MPIADPDDTIRLTQAPPRPTMPQHGRGGRWHIWAGSSAVLVVLLLGAGLWAWRKEGEVPAAPAASGAQAPPTVSMAVAPAASAIPVMERAAVLDWRPVETTLVRMADRPAVFLIAFPDMRQQGRMMNRIAALVEKARTPRDRVLDDASLAAAIAAEGEDPDTYYYGHNYTLADVERFFAIARASGVALNAEEGWLEARLPMMRAAIGNGPGAIITLPGEDNRFDASARRAVLEHESGHGRFFTDAPFADHVMRAWREVFTEADRAAFRRFLASEGYDTTNELLMANEAMAYLLFTPDARFFDPARDLQMDPVSAERLRAAMRPAEQ